MERRRNRQPKNSYRDFTYTVTQTVAGCTSAASNAVTTAPTAAPTAPILSVVNNCGSSILTVTGVTGTLTWSDGGTGNPRTVTGTLTYTVTQTVAGCTSAASNAVTTAPTAAPTAPILSVVNNCGSSTLTVTGTTGTLTWSDGGTGNPRTVTNAATYTVTQTIAGCISAASNAVTTAPTAAPTAPVLSVVNNCGSSTLTVAGISGTLTWSDGGTGNPRTVTGTLTYTVTQTVAGCTSAASNAVTTAPSSASAPVLSVVNNCGNSILTATGVTGTLTWSDGGTGNPRTVTVTLNYTVTQTVAGCTSAASNAVTTAPSSASAPVLSVINNCGSSILTATGVTGTLTWSDGGTGNPRTVTNSATYSVTQTIAGCTSAASNAVTTAPSSASAPVLSVVNNCGNSILTATGVTGTLTWSDGGTGNPRTVTNSATYSVTQTVAGCTSAASDAVTSAPGVAPSPVRVAVSIQPSCDVPTGTIVFSSPVGADLLYSINGINYQPSGSFALLPPGQYSASVRDISTGCVTTPLPLTVKAVDPATCGNRDIYFPSVFTPNADGKNDGFGPGPLSNLAGISAYTLSVYNRYGQLIFTTHDPLKKWDGMYKGYLLANYSYVWQASYKKANGTERLQKGTVLIIK